MCRLLVKLVARWLAGQKVEDGKADEHCEELVWDLLELDPEVE